MFLLASKLLLKCFFLSTCILNGLYKTSLRKGFEYKKVVYIFDLYDISEIQPCFEPMLSFIFVITCNLMID